MEVGGDGGNGDEVEVGGDGPNTRGEDPIDHRQQGGVDIVYILSIGRPNL